MTDEGLKGVIHVQVSFKNTLMTITKVIDQVVSWSNPALEQGHNLLFKLFVHNQSGYATRRENYKNKN